jgi:hypothetical protein
MMNKLLLTMMTLLLTTVSAAAQDYEVITEQPDGKLIDNMVLSFKGFKNIGSPTYLVEEARIAKVVEGTDGCIYIYNLFDYDTFKSWVKATRGEGDTIVIKRQLVLTNPQSSGTTELLYVAKYTGVPPSIGGTASRRGGKRPTIYNLQNLHFAKKLASSSRRSQQSLK